MADHGAQEIKLNGLNEDGDMTGTRHDGAKVVIKPASPDKAGAVHVKNITPTLAHALYFTEQIDDRQIQACEMLQENYYEAGLQPRVGASYSPAQTGGQQDKSDRQEKHRIAFNNAVRSLGEYGNTVQAAVLDNVQPNSMQRLKLGIDLLANHYGV